MEANKIEPTSPEQPPHADDSREQGAATTGPSDEREMSILKKLLSDSKAEQVRMNQVGQILFQPGIDRAAKKKQIVDLGYSPTQVVRIMMDKEYLNQHGEPVIRPGFTPDQKAMVSRNIRLIEESVKEIEQRLGIEHTSQVDRGRETGETDKVIPF